MLFNNRSPREPQNTIVVSDKEEISDDEEYTMNKILKESRHRDGSISMHMDTWWKKEFCIANRNESK